MSKRNLNTFLGVGLVTTVSLGTLAPSGLTVFAAEKETVGYHSNGVIKFTANEDGTLPVDPENPDGEKPVTPVYPGGETNPGTSGPLSIDFASSLDFGKNKISSKDEIYYANPQYFLNEETGSIDLDMFRPNYVQVTDNRGTNGGWILTVKQITQFRNENTQNQELTGAEINFTAAEAVSAMENVESPNVYDITLIPEFTSIAMNATEGAGAGTWVDRFGTIEDVEVDGELVPKDTAITLSVPGSTSKDAVEYKTELLWTLTDAPENEFKGAIARAFNLNLEDDSDSDADGIETYSNPKSVDYSSNGSVSFVKSTDDPKTPGSEKPEEEDSQESTGDSYEKEEKPNKVEEESKGKLPNTGQKTNYTLSLGGIILISLLLIINKITNKTKKSEE